MHWIVDRYFPEYEVKTFKYKLGKRLNKGDKSSALYAVMSTKKEIVLRCAIDINIANAYTECDSRYLREIFLIY